MNKKIIGAVIALALLGLFVLGTTSCSESKPTTEKPAATPAGRAYPYKVVATVGMVANIVQAIAGDRAEVTALMGAGIDPHLYTPTRDDVAKLMAADVVFYSGLKLEGRMGDTLAKMAEKKPVFAVADTLPKEYILFHGAFTEHGDPHVWMDAQGWMAATKQATVSLCEYDPDNAMAYKTRSAAYLIELGRLDEYARNSFSTIPAESRVLVTAHDAFGYMARAYGLEVYGIQGISTESEAGLQDISRLVGLLKDRDIRSVFVESSVSEKNVRALIEGAKARGHEVQIGGELYSDAMGPSGTYEGTYIGMIDHNVTIITRGLGGEAPETGMQGLLTPAKPHK
jgi:manganese/zinc/iron transport system substrate-binding protein